MKVPEQPPVLTAHLQDLMKEENTDAILDLSIKIASSEIKSFDGKGRYLHWEKHKHLEPPEGYTQNLHWFATKSARQKMYEPLPFRSVNGEHFQYCLPSPVFQDIVWVSEQAKGVVAADPKIKDPKTKNTYLISSLIDEAISSSQLEGASTTRPVAKEMIRTSRKPKGKSEQMIFNNYQAMLFIKEHVEDDISPSLIFELHEILTEDTFDDGSEHMTGCFRTVENDIAVVDDLTGKTLHYPPPVASLPERLLSVCDFANEKSGDKRMLPIIRAIVVHFMIGYDHPFFDGNGRTARALFYWVMAKSGFWLMEYVAISAAIKESLPSYLKAYLYTETDENDVTYFIIHQLDVIRKAIDGLHQHLLQKTKDLQETEAALTGSPLAGTLNHRQLAVLKNAIKNPGAQYTIKSHQSSHAVAYQTARTDLLVLSGQYGLLMKIKEGKTDIFVSPIDIAERIKNL